MVLAQFWHSNGRPRVRFKLASIPLTTVNLISSEVAGIELNREKHQVLIKSASSDFPSLFLFCLPFGMT
jgi:hypothetical protein